MLELPTLPRRELGFERTTCACEECTRNCRFVPGCLIPTDIERMHAHLAPEQDIYEWARENLLASPGALVAYRGEAFRIPTLVPARGPDGMACKFLTDEGKCSVHTVSPFGCAFVDMHMTDDEGVKRSTAMLQVILEDWRRGGLYSDVHNFLSSERKFAPSADECREKMRESCATEH